LLVSEEEEGTADFTLRAFSANVSELSFKMSFALSEVNCGSIS
jgi:hypothetical protein